MSRHQFRLWVRNSRLQRVIPIDPTSLTYRRTWLDFSGWEIRVAPPVEPPEGDTEAFQDYTDHVAALNALLDAGSGIIVEDTNGTVDMSGSAHLTEGGTATAFTREQLTDETTGVTTDSFVVAGRDDMTVLADRLAAPDPERGLTGNHYANYNGKGAASQLIRDLILVNAGEQAAKWRDTFELKVPRVGSFGVTMTMPARWANLLEVVREVCMAGGVTVDVTQTAGDALQVSIEPTRDRSEYVIFGVDARTLQGAQINSSLTEATTVLVAGQGEGKDRMVVEVPEKQDPNIVSRREHFLDRRDLTTIEELKAAGQAWLDEAAGVVTVTVEPDQAADGAILGVDYRLGDLVGVQAVAGGPVAKQRVTAIDVTAKSGRLDRTIRLGSPQSFGVDALLSRLDSHAARIARLEKS